MKVTALSQSPIGDAARTVTPTQFNWGAVIGLAFFLGLGMGYAMGAYDYSGIGFQVSIFTAYAAVIIGYLFVAIIFLRQCRIEKILCEQAVPPLEEIKVAVKEEIPSKLKTLLGKRKK